MDCAIAALTKASRNTPELRAVYADTSCLTTFNFVMT